MAQDIQEIWASLRDRFRTFVAKRVADEAEVDDILQEVFLRMHRKLDSLKDPDKILSWLYQITRHAIIDHYRASARTCEMPIGLSGDLDSALPSSMRRTSSTDSGQLRKELAGCLKSMIERLGLEWSIGKP